ncbi:MAG: glutathione S-transferase family protein [Alphaproteobacteria bacterium]|nr:glutathione S-transferase family protein [Alphaproteobacteria bacterium]MCB9928065.1 glutathione S-transferase family protein [Alphaproteobacteria bacterium]
MATLYHHPLSPFCRKVRILAAEKSIPVALEQETPWQRRPEFLAMSPGGTVPVWMEDDGTTIADSAAICEYLDEISDPPGLIGEEPIQRAETRRLTAWFDGKFHDEVTRYVHGERLLKRLRRDGEPNSAAIRAGRQNLVTHLAYIDWLTDHRNWLAGHDYSLADIAAAAQLSVLDYLGEVPWDEAPGAKEWYQRIKSRPTFRSILADSLPGFLPPAHYADLDF